MDQTFSALSNSIHQNNPLMRQYSLKPKETKNSDLRSIKERSKKEFSSRGQLIVRNSSFNNLGKINKIEQEMNQNSNSQNINQEFPSNKESENLNQEGSNTNLKLLNFSKEELYNFSSAKHSPINIESRFMFDSKNNYFFSNQQNGFKYYHPKMNIINEEMITNSFESNYPKNRFFSISSYNSPIKESS